MKKISNYADLVAERVRLEEKLVERKASFRREVDELKAKVAPVTSALRFMGIFKRKPDQSLLKFGADVGIELLVRNRLLAKSNWITRMIVPFLLKGVTSGALSAVKQKAHREEAQRVASTSLRNWGSACIITL